MRRLRAALAALLLAPALVVLGPGSALACSCAVATTAEFVDYADTVVVGEIVAVEPPAPRSDGLTDTGDPMTYTLAVETVFKGEPANPFDFTSASSGSACGLENTTPGREYVVFVTDGEATLCDGTAPRTRTLVAEVEAVTGPGTAAPALTTDDTAAPAPDAAQDAGGGALTWVTVAVGALALLALAWYLRGRWSRRSPG